MPWRLDWESVRHDDDSSQECFRKYYEPAESFNDHCFWQVEVGMLACSICQKKIIRMGKWSQKSGLATDQISREAHIIYWALWFGTLWCHCYWERLYSIWKARHKNLLLTVRIDPYMRCKKGDIPFSKKYNLLVNELKQINNLSANTYPLDKGW
jgi:hypothetical protein